MRILYIDIDSLRPDHLGCYGYHRHTTPNIDRIAAEGLRFTNCYASDAPCLPSRTALFTGRFGIHTGVVNHGGVAADPPVEGVDRGFRSDFADLVWMQRVRAAGYHTVSVSPFGERHSALHYGIGFNESYNTGKNGNETADEIAPSAIDWIGRNGARDDWFMHLNFWDPHTRYRTPESFGNPFEDEPPPSWHTEEIRQRNWDGYGGFSAQEGLAFGEDREPAFYGRTPRDISSQAQYKKWIDGYDTGIRFADDHVGQVLDALERQGVLDETVVIVSADHGENLGELNVYGDHQTADHCTCNIPLIIRWPGLRKGVEPGFCYNLDLAATVTDLLGREIPAVWDGLSFADALRGDDWAGRDYLVISQCAHVCQRSVRFGPWLVMRTYHDGFKDLPPLMVYNIDEDPHEVTDLSESHPEIADQGVALLDEWQAEMVESSPGQKDPMDIVLEEGGPFHYNRFQTRSRLEAYCERLRETGRGHHADELERKYLE